jgi:hypothetical protein
MLCDRPADPFCNKVAAARTSADVEGGIEDSPDVMGSPLLLKVDSGPPFEPGGISSHLIPSSAPSGALEKKS